MNFMSKGRVRGTVALALCLALVTLSTSAPAQKKPHPKHKPAAWSKCERCRSAYDKAMAHSVTRLRRASFPAKMVMGWLFLADGRHPRELKNVIDEAMRWKQRVGRKAPNNHRRNWYPALAGILLAEYAKYEPSQKLRTALQDLVDHFVFVQERTGGWYKWHEGAYKDRLDYPVKDLGILNAMIFGFLCTVKTQGVNVPTEAFKRADACLTSLLSRRGISYGTGSRGGDVTGARGAFALNGLFYARDQKHKIAKIYADVLPRQIPKMDQGHHVGAFHCLGVALGCHLLGPKVYKQLTDHWLDKLIAKQKQDGGIYVGDDGDAGGEVGLLGEDDGSTAAAALLILLQDSSRLTPSKQPKINWLAMDLPAAAGSKSKVFRRAPGLAKKGKLAELLTLANKSLTARRPPAEDELAAATTIKMAVERHAKKRLREAKAHVEGREVRAALEILEPLAKNLANHELGRAAGRVLADIRADPGLQRELKAQKELAKAWQVAWRKGLQKARKAFEKVIKSYPQTLAAKKARDVIG